MKRSELKSAIQDQIIMTEGLTPDQICWVLQEATYEQLLNLAFSEGNEYHEASVIEEGLGAKAAVQKKARGSVKKFLASHWSVVERYFAYKDKLAPLLLKYKVLKKRNPEAAAKFYAESVKPLKKGMFKFAGAFAKYGGKDMLDLLWRQKNAKGSSALRKAITLSAVGAGLAGAGIATAKAIKNKNA